jgi:hypothetical protein
MFSAPKRQGIPTTKIVSHLPNRDKGQGVPIPPSSMRVTNSVAAVSTPPPPATTTNKTSPLLHPHIPTATNIVPPDLLIVLSHETVNH